MIGRGQVWQPLAFYRCLSDGSERAVSNQRYVVTRIPYLK